MALDLILGRSRPSRGGGIGFVGRSDGTGGGEVIAYSGDGHLMTFAPTGAGKTSGPVICNALTHPGQLIVIDIKGEIHEKTAAARRAMGQEVHVLDMRDGKPLAGSLNPLDLLSVSGTDISAMARGFAAELVERAAEDRDRFWSDWSEIMITGGLAWLMADNPPEKRTLSSLFDLFMDEDVTYRLSTLLDEKRVENKTAKSAFAAFLQLSAEVTRTSVMASVQAQLRLFDSDMVRRLTDTSSMDISKLVEGEPMTIYIIVPPLRLNAYRPLLRVWLSSLILAMTQRQSVPKERTLMLCDEMGNLGRVDALLMAATLMRSWGLTLWTFWQSTSQLQQYGAQAATLIDNAAVIQAFGVKNLRTANDFVTIVGGISAEQILAMPSDEQVLLIDGKAVRCRQARYYNDDLFMNHRWTGSARDARE
jgi:type IV secretion system protein VirD4